MEERVIEWKCNQTMESKKVSGLLNEGNLQREDISKRSTVFLQAGNKVLQFREGK